MRARLSLKAPVIVSTRRPRLSPKAPVIVSARNRPRLSPKAPVIVSARNESPALFRSNADTTLYSGPYDPAGPWPPTFGPKDPVISTSHKASFSGLDVSSWRRDRPKPSEPGPKAPVMSVVPTGSAALAAC